MESEENIQEQSLDQKANEPTPPKQELIIPVLGKSMEEEINELGGIIYTESLNITHRMLQFNQQPTKEELEKQNLLNKQLKLLVGLNKALRKSNKVGAVNEDEWKERFAEIMKEKNSVSDIVKSID